MSYRYLAFWRDHRRLDSQANRTEGEGSRRSRSMPVYTYTTLEDPLAPDITGAYGINDNGQIVGYYIDASYHGFLYSNGAYTTLNDPSAGSAGTVAIGINASGQIVGDYFDANFKNRGFLYSGGSYTTLDDPLAVVSTVATGINDKGQIVGYYHHAISNNDGFLRI